MTYKLRAHLNVLSRVIALAVEDEAQGVKPRSGRAICRKCCTTGFRIGHEAHVKSLYSNVRWNIRKGIPFS